MTFNCSEKLRNSILQNIHKRAVQPSLVLHKNHLLIFLNFIFMLALEYFPRKHQTVVTFITKKPAAYSDFRQYSVATVNTFNTMKSKCSLLSRRAKWWSQDPYWTLLLTFSFHYPLPLHPPSIIGLELSILLRQKQASEQRPFMTATNRHHQSGELGTRNKNPPTTPERKKVSWKREKRRWKKNLKTNSVHC